MGYFFVQKHTQGVVPRISPILVNDMSNTTPNGNISVKQNQGKGFIIASSVIAVIVFFFAGLLAFQLSTATPPAPVVNSSQLPDSLVPRVLAVKIVQENVNIPVGYLIGEVAEKRPGYYVEWQLFNSKDNKVSEGVVRDYSIEGLVNVTQILEAFTLHLRTSDGVRSTKWDIIPNLNVEVGSSIPSASPSPLPPSASPVPLPPATKTPVNPEYFETSWAKKENTTITALAEAVEIAWNATKVNFYSDSCMLLNHEVLEPGEMVAPIPDASAVPSDLVLKYEVITNMSNKLSVAFYWCLKG